MAHFDWLKNLHKSNEVLAKQQKKQKNNNTPPPPSPEKLHHQNTHPSTHIHQKLNKPNPQDIRQHQITRFILIIIILILIIIIIIIIIFSSSESWNHIKCIYKQETKDQQ